jgi:hypothetical protein
VLRLLSAAAVPNNFVFSDADFKLAPFFDGYDRNRLDEHERELNVCSIF